MLTVTSNQLLRTFLLIALVILSFLISHAQTPGLIVRPAGGPYSTVLDKNQDGFTSTTSSGFLNSDVGASNSEIPYKIIPPYKLEPESDLMRGPDKLFSDLVRLTADESGMYIYNDGTNMYFRLRLGGIISGSKGYSILIDADNKFGAIGTSADPTYQAATTGSNGNPGFELEVVLETNFRVAIYDVNTLSTPKLVKEYTDLNQYSQISLAYSNVSGTPDYLYDFYVPLSELKYTENSQTVAVTPTTPLRISGTTVMAPQAAIGGPKSDIYGYDGKDYMSAWETIINNQPAFTPNQVLAGGTGVSVCTAAPTVDAPISTGVSDGSAVPLTITGKWTQSDPTRPATTATITLYQNGNSLGTTTVTSGGSWSYPGISTKAGDKFYATAISGGQTSCFQSNTVTAVGCGTQTPQTSFSIVCASNRGFDGTIPAGGTVRVYQLTPTGPVLYSTGVNAISYPTSTTWKLEGTSTNTSGQACQGSSGDIASGSYFATVTLAGQCESAPLFSTINQGDLTCISNGNGGTPTATPTFTTPIEGATSIGGTAAASSVVYLWVGGIYQGTVTANASGGFTFNGLTLISGQAIEIRARSGTTCVSAAATGSVGCIVSSVPIITANSSNQIANNIAISGISYLPGATIDIYNAATNTIVGTSTTVATDGTWTSTVIPSNFSGVTTFYVKQRTSCGTSPASATVTVLTGTATTRCGTISTTPLQEDIPSVSGSLAGTAASGTIVTLYLDGISIGSYTTPSATNSWGPIVVNTTSSNKLYAGGKLSIGVKDPNQLEYLCPTTYTIVCASPPTPALLASTFVLSESNGTFNIRISNSKSGILYTLEDASGVDKSKSVFGNDGSITLNSYVFSQAGSFPLRVTAYNLSSGCSSNQSLTLNVTDNDGDGISDPVDIDDDNDGILDTNESATYDATGDADGDGISNYKDLTPGVTGLPVTDSNSDGVLDYFDTDRDGIINQFDVDTDNDGIPDVIENGGADADNDGKIDGATDSDLDGLRDAADATKTTGAAGSNGLSLVDFDGDTVPNFRDLDSDGDGVLDSRESGLGFDTNNNGLLNDDAGYADANKDGWSDAVDALTPLNLRNTDGISKPDYLDIDNDDDGIVDNIEAQATTAYLAPSGTDTDKDGIDDNYDKSITIFGGIANNGLTPVNNDTDTMPDYRDTDSDNDGFPDSFEGHDTDGDNLPNANAATKNGIGGTADVDGDGLLDGYDNNTSAVNVTNNTTPTSYPNIDKPGTPERDWREVADNDGDGVPDLTDIDDDNDGIPDTVESGNIDPLGDADGDGVLNYLDKDLVVNSVVFSDTNNDGINDVFDADKDGIMNSLDLDSDNDGIPDIVEAGGIDTDGNGRVDGAFADSDGDGLHNKYDASSGGFAIANLDTDGDGIKNFLDLDSDNDGIPDVVEVGGVDANGDGRIDGFTDADGDGLANTVDADANNDGTVEAPGKALLLTGPEGTVVDGKPDTYPQGINNTDGGGLPNPYDLDSDNDGIPDIVEAGGTDADYNGKVDFSGTFASNDTDVDGYINTYDTDANNDGVAEATNKALILTGPDANADGKADSYTMANADGGTLPNPYDLDSDNDGIPDLIEQGGVDANGDGMIDVLSDADGNGWQNSYDPTQSGINIRIIDVNGAVAGGILFDFDGDGIANYLDLDSDNDGIPDLIEQGGTDSNNDGKLDASTDADNDGFMDSVDPVNNATGSAIPGSTVLITTGSTTDATSKLPVSYSSGSDFDGKGLINMLDLDSDDDGILDTREAGLPDANNDGKADGTLGADGWSDTVDALASLNLPNTDGKAKANYLDIDSDDDGIVDNVEAQTTVGYLAPLGTDADKDGIDDRYDNNNALFGGNVNAANGLAPVNTDNSDNPDYTDLDSDNDGYSDRLEGWDANGNHKIDNGEIAYVGTSDADGDGLLDEYDVNDNAINPTNGTTPASYPNAERPLTPERDWRESADNDNDGVPNNIDVDDDNDGITDVIESGGVDPLGDFDNDGTPNYLDTTPGGSLPSFIDTNGDGINDNYDADKDGIINAFDLDSDNDGIPDLIEAGGVDVNGDGTVDYSGAFSANDSDNDGLINKYDASTGGTSIANLDTDGDGIPNSRDLDSDNDGIPDIIEAGGVDANRDGQADYTGTFASNDTDGDGFINTYDADANNDGTAENTASALIITGADVNNDGKPDSYPRANADKNGLPNPYDLDSDGDGILDAREANMPDSDNNGIVDGVLLGGADANGWSNTVEANTWSIPNSDSDNKPNYLDIDSDNDGITDNVEGQPSDPYAAPSGSDSDGDGIDDVYDNNDALFGGGSNNGITPVNTDAANDAIPDYLDLDTDNDGDPDLIEGNDLNGNGRADDHVVLLNVDTDGDGLDDFFETDVNNGPIVTIAGFTNTTPGGKSPAQRTATASGTNRDWRNTAFSLTANSALPVQFVTFIATKQSTGVQLVWNVTAEQNVKNYEVERSPDGFSFSKVGQVAYKAPAGNINKYQFFDATLTTNIIYYRIRQVDLDGKYMYSGVVTVTSGDAITKLAVHPNPVQSQASVVLNVKSNQKSVLMVSDMQGRILSKKDVELQKGHNVITADQFSQLPGGTYILLAEADGILLQAKFAKR